MFKQILKIDWAQVIRMELQLTPTSQNVVEFCNARLDAQVNGFVAKIDNKTS